MSRSSVRYAYAQTALRRDVSFTYPDAPRPALQDMSFKIEPGQLCVIVGENGSK